MSEDYTKAFWEVQKADFQNMDWKKLSRILHSVNILYESDDEGAINEELLSQAFLSVMSDFFVKAANSAEITSEEAENAITGARILCCHLEPDNRTRIVAEASIHELCKKVKSDYQMNPKFHIELYVKSIINLKPNLRCGAYESFELYLATQRDLIAEDFFRPLREGLKGSSQSSKKLLHSYGAGIVEKIYLDRVLLVIEKVEKASPSIDWHSTSRLIFGSLVILTTYEPSFWTVQERNLSSSGKLEIFLLPCCNSSDHQEWPQEGQKVDVKEPVIYYEAYKHVINALYSLKRISFEDAIVRCDKRSIAGLNRPNLRMKKNGSATILSTNDLFKALYEHKQESFDNLSLKQLSRICNKSQIEAIELSLSRKIGLIQGPPGTGKSYVGSILAKILISNKRRRPLVVICFTNHALDSFLESLVEFTPKIIRIGGRSKSALLEAHNLTSLKRYLIDSGSRDKKIYKAIQALEQDLRQASTYQEHYRISCAIRNWNNVESLQLISKADVIGMTTTGAAKHSKLLRMLDPEAMIIDEAGQVLESHVLAALTPNLEQLIMIGDHQQLKPNVSTYELAKEFHLDLSLFERLINNGFDYVQLREQHRMRPEISQILRNNFYPDLQDHMSVENYNAIRGVGKNVFFLDHSVQEDHGLSDSMSKTNRFEAEFLLDLGVYLLNNGYEASQITILAAYQGQSQLMQKLASESGRKFNVNVVDNYQGEENDIILLSLVRSNDQGTIGFLSVRSRICVALSRAKMGLYVVGNMADLAKKSEAWKSIRAQLEQNDLIGSQLSLVCPSHPMETKFSASTPQQIAGFPGCSLICGEILLCGHQCDFMCHGRNPSHEGEFKCRKLCSKTCAMGHPCLKKCYEMCNPCTYSLDEIFEPCGHISSVSCPTNNMPKVCNFKIQVELQCGHSKVTSCGQTSLKCEELCDFILNCGHKCGLACHPGAKHNDKCMESCGKMNKNCFFQQHPCAKSCYQNCEECPEIIHDFAMNCGHKVAEIRCGQLKSNVCMQKCDKTLSCGIHRCRNFCYEDCEPFCSMVLKKNLSCGHAVESGCQVENEECQLPCSRLLQCGHPCPLKCYQSCSNAECQVLVSNDDKFACGHSALRKCGSLETSSNCTAVCSSMMECGHICGNKCSECLNGQLHLPCVEKCPRSLLCGHPCQLKCGQVCQPCSKQKCLFQCQHKKCKAFCDDSCSDCKEKCGLGCEHSKCTKKCYANCNRNPCQEQCKKSLICGHPCQGFCGEMCPQAACPVCNIEIKANFRYVQLPDCPHCFTEEDLETIISDKKVGVPKCSICNAVITHLPRYKMELRERKKKVVEVFDLLFAYKSNLTSSKQTVIELSKLNETIKLSKYVALRCADKTSPLSYFELQDLHMRLFLLEKLMTKEEAELEKSQTVINFLNSDTSEIGPHYLKKLNQVFENIIQGAPAYVSFHHGSWFSSPSGEVKNDLSQNQQ